MASHPLSVGGRGPLTREGRSAARPNPSRNRLKLAHCPGRSV